MLCLITKHYKAAALVCSNHLSAKSLYSWPKQIARCCRASAGKGAQPSMLEHTWDSVPTYKDVERDIEWLWREIDRDAGFDRHVKCDRDAEMIMWELSVDHLNGGYIRPSQIRSVSSLSRVRLWPKPFKCSTAVRIRHYVV